MYRRPLPHIHRCLRNLGLSAAMAAEVIRAYRMKEDASGLCHELLRAVWQNRGVFKAELSGSVRYR